MVNKQALSVKPTRWLDRGQEEPACADRASGPRGTGPIKRKDLSKTICIRGGPKTIGGAVLQATM